MIDLRAGLLLTPRLCQDQDMASTDMEMSMLALEFGKFGLTRKTVSPRTVNPLAKRTAIITRHIGRVQNFAGVALYYIIQTYFPALMRLNCTFEIKSCSFGV